MPRGKKDGSIRKIPQTVIVKGKPKESFIYEVRKRYTVEGREREKKRRSESYTEILELKKEIEDEIERELAGDGPRIDRTFAEVLTYFREHYAKPAEYVGDVKVEGYRSINSLESHLKPVEEHFSGMLLRSITYEKIKAYKKKRLATPIVTKRKKGKKTIVTSRTRSATSVHRELQLLRRILNIGIKKKWISENAFHFGDPLILSSSEPERMRILTRAEETALLDVCVEPRAHLADAIICALDTALRENEQFALECSDVDLIEKVIFVKKMSSNRKRQVDRRVPITSRLLPIMERLVRDAGGVGKIFPHHELKRSFKTACRIAKIEGLRWHDLRHTAITWMVGASKDSSEVMRISGHKQWSTFLRYVNINNEVAREMGVALDTRRENLEVTQAPEHVN